MDLRANIPVLMYMPGDSYRRTDVDPIGIDTIESIMSGVPICLKHMSS